MNTKSTALALFGLTFLLIFLDMVDAALLACATASFFLWSAGEQPE